MRMPLFRDCTRLTGTVRDLRMVEKSKVLVRNKDRNVTEFYVDEHVLAYTKRLLKTG